MQSPSISTEKVNSNSDKVDEQADNIYDEEDYDSTKMESGREESEYELTSTPSYKLGESVSNTNLNFETPTDPEEITESPPDVSEIFDKFAPRPTDISSEAQSSIEKERDYENCRLADQAFSWNDGQEGRRTEVIRPASPSPVQQTPNLVKNTAAHILARPIDIEKKDDVYETYTTNVLNTNSNFNDSGYYGKNYKRVGINLKIKPFRCLNLNETLDIESFRYNGFRSKFFANIIY